MTVTTPWMRVREVLIRSENETDPRYGCKPQERSIQEHIHRGIVNLDKPPGPSSHEVVAWIKRILDLKHAGSGGTLETNWSGRPQSHRRSSSSL